MSELSKQQKNFLEEYATSLNIKNSATLAGYNEKIALKQGRYFLKKEKYLNALNDVIEGKVDHLEIPKAFIIKKFVQLIDWASGEHEKYSENSCGAKICEGKDEVKKAKENDENKTAQKAHLRAFSPPKDPQILLRALEGLVKFLERGKENGENKGSDDFASILGVNCEKI